jgi:two-component system chemotaxis response regulator CheY
MAKTIMIVDDSASVRQVVGIALRSAGYDVLEGCDGKDALSKLTGQKIHLIVSDVNMPNMGGIDFVKGVKALAAYRFTPVIMLTTESQEGLDHQALPAGDAAVGGREAGAAMSAPGRPKRSFTEVQSAKVSR